jgi:Formamidopyrimidine-DNA glycosylase N-terminal domain
MPELPDVEVFKRYLDATALNQKIARVSVKNRRVLRHIAPRTLAQNLRGRALRSSRRHGKFLFGQLDRDGSVIFHFGMTGFLKYFKDKAGEPKHTRVRMDFSNGSFLGFVCPRMFGEVDHTGDVNRYIEKRGLGPDALAVSWQEFKERLWGAKSSIKSALMDHPLRFMTHRRREGETYLRDACRKGWEASLPSKKTRFMSKAGLQAGSNLSACNSRNSSSAAIRIHSEAGSDLALL